MRNAADASLQYFTDSKHSYGQLWSFHARFVHIRTRVLAMFSRQRTCDVPLKIVGTHCHGSGTPIQVCAKPEGCENFVALRGTSWLVLQSLQLLQLRCVFCFFHVSSKKIIKLFEHEPAKRNFCGNSDFDDGCWSISVLRNV